MAAFLIFPFEVRAIPMFSVGEKKPTTSSGKSADTPEQQGRRETDPAGDLSFNEESSSSQATRGTTCRAVDYSEQDDHLNIGAERAAIEEKDQREEEERAALRLEDFRAAVENPDFTGVKRLIIDPESHVIRPWSGADSKFKEKMKPSSLLSKRRYNLNFQCSSRH